MATELDSHHMDVYFQPISTNRKRDMDCISRNCKGAVLEYFIYGILLTLPYRGESISSVYVRLLLILWLDIAAILRSQQVTSYSWLNIVYSQVCNQAVLLVMTLFDGGRSIRYTSGICHMGSQPSCGAVHPITEPGAHSDKYSELYHGYLVRISMTLLFRLVRVHFGNGYLHRGSCIRNVLRVCNVYAKCPRCCNPSFLVS